MLMTSAARDCLSLAPSPDPVIETRVCDSRRDSVVTEVPPLRHEDDDGRDRGRRCINVMQMFCCVITGFEKLVLNIFAIYRHENYSYPEFSST